MRVAKHVFGQYLLVRPHLALGIKAAAGVVQVDLPQPVEPGVVALAQLVQVVGSIVSRVF